MEYIADEYRSKAIIRASVNHHDWYGVISTFKYDQVIQNLNLTAELMLDRTRVYITEVVNLLDDYYVDFSDDNDLQMLTKSKIGDKVAYHNIGYNSWFGGFVQGEYSMDDLTGFVSAAGSNTTYKEDFFNYTDDSGDQNQKKLNIKMCFKNRC